MDTRDANIAKNVAASFAIRGGSLVLALLTMPAYIRFFDDQQVLGVWFTVTATLSWILNFDIGLGNGLRNRLVGPLEDRDMERARGYISSTYVASFALILIVGTVVAIVVPVVNWNAFFSVPSRSIASGSLTSSVGIVLGGLLAQFLFRTISAILFALQKSAMPALLSLITTASLLAFVTLVESGTAEENMLLLAKAYALAVNLPLIGATLVVFATSLRACLPSPRAFRFEYARDVMTLGGVFFLLQVMYMLLANTNPFLISWLSEPSYVVEFQIYSRPFGVISSLFALALTPIWSAVTEAIGKADYAWIGRLFKRLSALALLATLVIFACVPGLQPFVNLWLGADSIHIDPVYGVVFAASASVFVWNGVISSIVNGTGMLRIQAGMLAVGVALKVLVSTTLTTLTGDWIWIILSDVAALGPYLLVQSFWLRRFLGSRVPPKPA